jgi:hypothetical protein
MKKIVFLLILSPLFTKAQNEAAEKMNNGKLVFVQAARQFSQPPVKKDDDAKRKKDDQVYVGDVRFKIGSTEINSDSAISYTNDGTMAFFHVKIANPESFDIVGDVLSYTKEDNTAALTENVSVTAKNGNVVGTSNYLKIDFSYEIDRIVNGSLTPPKRADDAGH